MKMHVFSSQQDNVVSEAASFDVPWLEVVKMLSEHRITDNKHELGLIFGRFETDRAKAEQAVSNRGQPNEKVHHGTVGRVAANLLTVEAVCLDFDGGCSLKELRSRLEECGLSHLGYTSYNHQNPDAADGPKDKFRIIIPLSTPCPKDEWVRRRHRILELFPEVDHSCIALARLFYAPSHKTGAEGRATTWHFEGLPLNWNDLEPKPAPPPPMPRVNPTVKGGHGRIVFKTFDAVRFLQDQGLYLRKVTAHKHEVVCPNVAAHTGQCTSGTVLFQDGTDFPNLYCSHAHCANFRFYDHYKALLGPKWMNNYCEREPELTMADLTARLTTTKMGN